MLMGDVRAEQFMRAMDPEILESLTPDQESAIRAAANRPPWDKHPIDLRVSLPTPFGRWYMTLVAGPERRNAARLKQERENHPLATPRNLALIGALIGTFAGLLAVLVFQILAGGAVQS